jgi:hypothetical protein
MVREDESLVTSGQFGEFHLSLNPRKGISADAIDYPDAFTLSVNKKECAPKMGCAGPQDSFVDPAAQIWKWSNMSTWNAIYNQRRYLWDAQANPNNTFPVEGEHVEIPGGFHVELDVPPCSTHPDVYNCIPKLGRVTVVGKFTIDDSVDRAIDADTILVWGEMSVGTPKEPFQHVCTITLHGTKASDTLVASDAHSLGNNVVAVFGNLTLHGTNRATRFVKIAETAVAGSTELKLTDSVDWVVDDKLTITPTGYDAAEVEVVQISAVSVDKKTLTLTKPLLYTHASTTLNLGGGKAPVILAATVGVLTGHSVVLTSNEAEDHGFHVVVGEHIYEGGAGDQRRVGKLVAAGVNFRNCGQTASEHPCIMLRYMTGISKKYSIFDWFYDTDADTPNNQVVSCSFESTLNGAVAGVKAIGFIFEDNVVHRTYRNALALDAGSEDAVVRRNLFVGNYRSIDDSDTSYCKVDNSCLVKPVSAIYIVAERVQYIQDNIVGGAEDTGLTYFAGEACGGGSVWDLTGGNVPRKSAFGGNEVHSAMTGIRILPHPGILALTKCLAVRQATVWTCSDVGIMTLDQMANVEVDEATVSDCHIGISLNFIRSGSENVVKVANSVIAGSSEATTCSSAHQCRSYSADDTLATKCNSVFGTSVHRIGLAIPRYAGHGSGGLKPQTCGAAGSKAVCRPITRPTKQCAAPWLRRYGRLNAEKATMVVHNTTFYGFSATDCGKSSRGIALISDEPDFFPELELSGLSWPRTDPRAKLKLGYDHGLHPQVCRKMCDSVSFGTAVDVDGTTCGKVGATMISAQTPELSSDQQCEYDVHTASYVCHSDFKLIPMALETAAKIGPVVVTRSVEGLSSRAYGSTGATDESCANVKKHPRYPFKIAIADVGVPALTTIKPAGSMTSDGRVVWFAQQGDVTVVELVFMKAYDKVSLYMDHRNQDKNRLEGGAQPVPTMDSAPGTWSYYPQTKRLTLVMHGEYAEYQWVAKVDEGVNVKLAMLIDIPSDAPAGFSATVVETFTSAIMFATSKRLNIPLSRFKVVCVHIKGQPCLKGGRHSRAESDGNEYEFEYLVAMKNEEGSGFTENGTKTEAYEENAEERERIIFEIKEATISGDLSAVLVNATTEALVTSNIIGVNASAGAIEVSTEDAGVAFSAAVSEDGAFVLQTTTSGTVFEDLDMNGIMGEGDTALADVVVTLTSAISSHIVTTDSEGGWVIKGLEPGTTYTLTLSQLPVPGPSHLSWKLSNEGGGDIQFEATTIPQSINVPYQRWLTTRGSVAEATSMGPMGLANIVVVMTDRSGQPYPTTTDSDGDWSVSVPLSSGLTIDVDESTLPFAQPYTATAVQGSGFVTLTAEEQLALHANKKWAAVYERHGSVSGTVLKEIGSTMQTPLDGVEIVITSADGSAWTTISDVNGQWALTAPLGAVRLSLGSTMCKQVSTTDPTAVVEPIGVADIGSIVFECIDQCISGPGCSGGLPICVDQAYSYVCMSTTATTTATTATTTGTSLWVGVLCGV